MTNNIPIRGMIYRGKDGRLRKLDTIAAIGCHVYVWWTSVDQSYNKDNGVCLASYWRRWVKEPVPTAN